MKHYWALHFLLQSSDFTGFAPYLLNDKTDYSLSQETVHFNMCGKDQKAASIWVSGFFSCPSDPSGSLDGVAESSRK